MENGRLPGESVLAVTFFKTYRPAGDRRSLESRGNQKVTKKKRSVNRVNNEGDSLLLLYLLQVKSVA